MLGFYAGDNYAASPSVLQTNSDTPRSETKGAKYLLLPVMLGWTTGFNSPLLRKLNKPIQRQLDKCRPPLRGK